MTVPQPLAGSHKLELLDSVLQHKYALPQCACIQVNSSAAIFFGSRGIKEHRFVHPLDTPGEADLSANVDFSALRYQLSPRETYGGSTLLHGLASPASRPPDECSLSLAESLTEQLL